MNNQVSSPISVESNGSNSKFKTLKKKIRNKFRLSRGDDVKTIAQAVETLKRSDELLSGPIDDPDQIKNEFKELKNALESIINQNQVLAEVVKSVDSSCPDPFNEPEKFSVYFAQKSISLSSLSDGFEDGNIIFIPDSSSAIDTEKKKREKSSSDVENALLRLQNLRMEEQRGFKIERENYETRLGQITLLQQEIELLRKQNSEHEIQIEFLKTQTQDNQIDPEINSLRTQLLAANEKYESEMPHINAKIEALVSENAAKENRLIKLTETIENLTKELENLKESNINENQKSRIEELEQSNDQLKSQLEEAIANSKALQENSNELERKEREFREISEENVRMKMEFSDLKRELSETLTQLADLEKEPISSITFEDEKMKTSDESAFKYVYLSNLVLKFLQFPEQRAELSNIILTTLQTDQEHFQKAMNMK